MIDKELDVSLKSLKHFKMTWKTLLFRIFELPSKLLMSQSERFRFRQADEDREVRQAEARVGQPDQLQEVIANAICNNIINS